MFESKYPETTIQYDFYVKYFNKNLNCCLIGPCEEINTQLRKQHLSQSVKLTLQGELIAHNTQRGCHDNYSQRSCF